MAFIEESRIGAYHLANNKELYEPQRKNNFELQVTGLDNLANIYNTEFDNKVITNASEVIRVSLAKGFVPSFAQQPIKIGYGNNDIKFAGKPEWNDGDITLNDYIGAQTKEVLLAWQRLSYNPRTQKVGRAKDYKKTAYVVETAPDGEIVRTWRVEGCWIKDLKFDEYSMDDSGKQQMTASISYDYAYPEVDED